MQIIFKVFNFSRDANIKKYFFRYFGCFINFLKQITKIFKKNSKSL